MTDEIIRVVKREAMVAVPRQALDDPRLSLAAKGLWAYLSAHPELTAEGFEADDLTRRGVGEADEIQRCLKALLQAGYLTEESQGA